MARDLGAGTLRRQRWIALLAMLGIHGLIGWGLLRVTRVPLAFDDSEGLQVVYLPAPRPVAVSRPVRRRHDAAPKSAAAPDRTTATALSAEFVARPADATAAVVAGDDRWQARTPGLAPARMQFAPKLANRVAALPGRAGGRFRMASPMSLADMVAAVGAHIAPQGYTQDPCPRNHENITGLMDGRDPAALQQELAFEREHCRP